MPNWPNWQPSPTVPSNLHQTHTLKHLPISKFVRINRFSVYYLLYHLTKYWAWLLLITIAAYLHSLQATPHPKPYSFIKRDSQSHFSTPLYSPSLFLQDKTNLVWKWSILSHARSCLCDVVICNMVEMCKMYNTHKLTLSIPFSLCDLKVSEEGILFCHLHCIPNLLSLFCPLNAIGSRAYSCLFA